MASPPSDSPGRCALPSPSLRGFQEDCFPWPDDFRHLDLAHLDGEEQLYLPEGSLPKNVVLEAIYQYVSSICSSW